MKINDIIYVDVRNNHRSIFDLLKWLDKGYFCTINRNDLTWDRIKQSEFIESCLMNIPFQPLYFHEQRDGRELVIDGTQRIITLDQFRKNEFILSELTINQNLNNINFDGLSTRYQNRFDDFDIKFHSFNPSTPKNIIDEFIRKINNVR
jgi:hypothetical protein